MRLDYDKWNDVYNSYAQFRNLKGIQLINIWRDLNDPDNISFRIIVEDDETTETFIASSESTYD